MSNNVVYKIMVVGNTSVGKTAFVRSYIFEKPQLENSSTVGVKTIHLPDRSTMKLQLWDIGGQDRSAFLLRSFCNRAHGCVLLFDVTNPLSFECVSHWKREVEKKCYKEGRLPIPCILIANKCDLTERLVSFEDIERISEELGFICWKSVSVKDELNVKDAMIKLIEAMDKSDQSNN